jgi:hypothetical protein
MLTWSKQILLFIIVHLDVAVALFLDFKNCLHIFLEKVFCIFKLLLALKSNQSVRNLTILKFVLSNLLSNLLKVILGQTSRRNKNRLDLLFSLIDLVTIGVICFQLCQSFLIEFYP